MLSKLIILAQSLSSMITHGKIPPNTPPEYIEEMKSINFLRNKKFFVVFTSVIMLVAFYVISVFILFLTSDVPSITTPFVTIFVETIKILAIIISTYLGLQAAIDFKYNSDSSTSLKSEIEYVKEEVQESVVQMFQERYKDDFSYAPIDWVKQQPYE